MLLAEHPSVADALCLLSYPLHPPKQPEKLRTAHWPNLKTPALFVHGTADPFGAVSELEEALLNLTAPHRLSIVPGAGHDLLRGKLDAGLVIQPLKGILDL